MVVRVSPSWVKMAPSRSSSSLLMLPARMFANAVMEALSPQAFTALTSRPSYARPSRELTTFAPGVILFS